MLSCSPKSNDIEEGSTNGAAAQMISLKESINGAVAQIDLP